MPVYGADVEQLEQLARKFDEESKNIRQAMTTVTGQMGQTWWQGPDANRFRSEWESTHRSALSRLADSLQQAAQQVKKQASEQRQVSGG
jgi:uncharacterized protein YukE